MLQNRTGFSKAEANGPEQWKATSRKAISALESAESADVICECRFYGLSVRYSSRKNGKRFTTGASVPQAAKDRLRMQVNTQRALP